jgi:SAM-dependent methyltransferase
MTSTDKAWEYYGNNDPYFGVLASDEFRRERLEETSRAQFFQSGEDHIAFVLDTAAEQFGPVAPIRALDFGCGVGRLTLPLARRCTHVVGVDVSPSMLDEARTNASAAGLSNVDFAPSDDTLSHAEGTFDLIHSYIVFQHIAPRRGARIFQHMVDRLDEGGLGIVQFTYANSSSTPMARRAMTEVYERVPFAFSARNLLKRTEVMRPPMRMGRYDLNRLLLILQEAGCHDVRVRYTEDSHFGYPMYGVMLYFVKRRVAGTPGS